MKKFLPHIVILLCLAGGVGYFIYEYSPSTMEKKDSDFAVKNIDDVTKVRLVDEKGNKAEITLKDKKWTVNGYEINEGARSLLFTAIQKLESIYQAPATAEPIVLKDIAKQYVKCEIWLNNEDKPSKVYYVGGPTADGGGTYMIIERDGHMARHPYITHIPGVNAYLTARYFPLIDRWRTIWVYRDNDRTIQSVKLDYPREKQKSFEIRSVAKDSFVIVNSDGQVGEQPKQRFIHQYLEFFSALPVEQYMNTNPARDTIVPMEPYCNITMKRVDGTEKDVTVYYMPINDQSRTQFDNDGRKLIFDIEHYYILFNDKKDFALIQYYTWGKALREYDNFFVKYEPKAAK